MSAQPVTADVKIGTVEGEIVDSEPRADYGTGLSDVHIIEADGCTYRVTEADLQ